MRVDVTLKKGGKFHRVENGRMRMYTHKDPDFSVSQHVFERFRDRFNVVGTEPPPSVQPTGQAPGTDDEVQLEEAQRPDDSDPGEQVSGETADGEPLEPIGDGIDMADATGSEGDPPAMMIVAELHRVGVMVRPEAAAGWTDQEVERAWAVVDRNGKGNLPAFIKNAVAPTE